MSINECLRGQTFAIHDSINQIEKQITETTSQRNAAETRVKRIKAEITKQKTIATEKDKDTSRTSNRITEIQKTLDELDKKRESSLDELIALQNSKRDLDLARRQAQDILDKAVISLKKEETSRQEEEKKVEHLLTSKHDLENKLNRCLIQGLETYLNLQSEKINSAFSTQEQRTKAMQELKAFKEARHSDLEIGRLCDERDEIKKILETVQVPGVKEILKKSLNEKEQIILKKYPDAFRNIDKISNDNPIEELLFYCNDEGKAIFLLPISLDEWEALKDLESTDKITPKVCCAWNMIKDLGLKKEDGEFLVYKNHIVFASNFDLETVTNQNFSVKLNSIEIMKFILSPVPSELQEAIINED